jgi:hypothetical protein
MLIGTGTLLIVAGIGVRTGLLRGWVPMHQTPGLPLILRNAPFVLIPGGLFPIGAVVVGNWPSDQPSSLRALIAIGLAFLPLVILVVAHRPPAWLKPDWLRVHDSAPTNHASPDRFDLAVFVAVLVAFLLLVASVAILIASDARLAGDR